MLNPRPTLSQDTPGWPHTASENTKKLQTLLGNSGCPTPYVSEVWPRQPLAQSGLRPQEPI